MLNQKIFLSFPFVRIYPSSFRTDDYMLCDGVIDIISEFEGAPGTDPNAPLTYGKNGFIIEFDTIGHTGGILWNLRQLSDKLLFNV